MSLAIQRLQEGFLREQGEHAAVLVTSQENRFYLTGFPSSAGAVLVTEKKASYGYGKDKLKFVLSVLGK